MTSDRLCASLPVLITGRQVTQALPRDSGRELGFGDHCTLRRELVNMKLLARTADGGQYRKLPARPDGDVAAMLRVLRSHAA